MKKFIFMIALIMGCVVSAVAQTAIVDNGTVKDNWYITGGVGTQLWNNQSSWTVLNHPEWCSAKEQQLHINVGVGKYFNPYVGGEVDYKALFNTGVESNFIDGHNLSLNAAINLSNVVFGYKGQSRKFEVELVAGPGWYHAFQTGVDYNAITARSALRFNLKVTKNLALNLTPEYVLHFPKIYDNPSTAHKFNVSVGVKWNIPSKRGGFHLCKLYDQNEVDGLNAQIAALREDVDKSNTAIAHLKKSLEEASNTNAKDVVGKEIVVLVRSVGTVLFSQGSSNITDLTFKKVLEVLKSTNGTITLTGMTSPEGSEEVNKTLGVNRAEAVKKALIDNGISEERIVIDNTYDNKRSVVIMVE